MLRVLPVIACCLCVSVASAHTDDVPIQTSADLRDWCRMASEAHFVGRGLTPYNWVASHVERGNAFHVDGRWRVDGRERAVTCRAARGAQQRFATMEIAGD